MSRDRYPSAPSSHERLNVSRERDIRQHCTHHRVGFLIVFHTTDITNLSIYQ